MAEQPTRVRLGAAMMVAALVVAAIVLTACEGRLRAGAGEPDTTPAPPTVDSPEAGGLVPTPTPPSPTPTPSPSAEPDPSAQSASAASPAATPKPAPKPPPATPVPTPNLSQLEQLLDQLDDALANDAAATTDEGSPQ